MKTFVVLGLGRSATSLVAKGLTCSGVHMGYNFVPVPDKDNIWGYWEDWDFAKLNFEILEAAGGSYLNPPPERRILEVGESVFESRIVDLIEKKTANARKNKLTMWGWKDSKTYLTIRLFAKYLDNPHFILCMREPLEVALSHKRLCKEFTDLTAGHAKRLYHEFLSRTFKFLVDWSMAHLNEITCQTVLNVDQ